MHVNSIPSKHMTHINVCTNSTNVSGLIFVVIQSLSFSFGLSRAFLFGCLSGILGVLLLIILPLWPNKVFMPGDIIKARKLGKPLDRGYTAHWSYPFYSVKRVDVKKKKLERSASLSIFGDEDEAPSGLCGCGDFWEAIRSLEFIGMLTYFSITIFNYNFFLGTASEQLILKGDNGDFLNAFAIIFPSGVIFLPLISCTLDRFKRFGLSIMLASVAATGVILIQLTHSLALSHTHTHTHFRCAGRRRWTVPVCCRVCSGPHV